MSKNLSTTYIHLHPLERAQKICYQGLVGRSLRLRQVARPHPQGSKPVPTTRYTPVPCARHLRLAERARHSRHQAFTGLDYRFVLDLGVCRRIDGSKAVGIPCSRLPIIITPVGSLALARWLDRQRSSMATRCKVLSAWAKLQIRWTCISRRDAKIAFRPTAKAVNTNYYG